jgi:hypothetical protein
MAKRETALLQRNITSALLEHPVPECYPNRSSPASRQNEDGAFS